MGPNLCESTAGFYHVSSMQKHNARAANGDVRKQACPNNPIDVGGESGIYARCTQVLQPLNEYARINCPKLRNCKILELPPNHGIPPWQSPHSAISFPSVREILSRELWRDIVSRIVIQTPPASNKSRRHHDLSRPLMACNPINSPPLEWLWRPQTPFTSSFDTDDVVTDQESLIILGDHLGDNFLWIFEPSEYP